MCGSIASYMLAVKNDSAVCPKALVANRTLIISQIKTVSFALTMTLGLEMHSGVIRFHFDSSVFLSYTKLFTAKFIVVCERHIVS